MNTNIKTREYTTVSEVSGPLMIVEGVEGVGYNEIVDIETPTGEKRSGQVLEVTKDEIEEHTSESSHRSEEHTSELQSQIHLVCRLLLEKKKK